MRLSRFLMIVASRWGAAGAQVAQAAFHGGPGALDGVEVGCIGGHLDDGQPVLVRLQHGAHHAADVRVQVVPAQDDRGMKLAVRGGDQAGVIGFGHGPAFALTAGVDAGPVEEPAAGTGPVAGHACGGHPAGAFPGHYGHRRVAAAGPGTGLRRAQGLPGLVLEAQIRPGRRR